MKYISANLWVCPHGRSPHGERGLKSKAVEFLVCICQSLPARGAWVEIAILGVVVDPTTGRSPHGERGLKS